MNIRYQNLNEAIAIIEKQFKRNRKRSISATLRSLRSKSYFSFFGDYPLLATIVHTIQNMGIVPSRDTVLYTMNLSTELSNLTKKEKTALLEQLMNPSPVKSKTVNINAQHKKKRKMNNVSFPKK